MREKELAKVFKFRLVLKVPKVFCSAELARKSQATMEQLEQEGMPYSLKQVYPSLDKYPDSYVDTLEFLHLNDKGELVPLDFPPPDDNSSNFENDPSAVVGVLEQVVATRRRIKQRRAREKQQANANLKRNRKGTTNKQEKKRSQRGTTNGGP